MDRLRPAYSPTVALMGPLPHSGWQSRLSPFLGRGCGERGPPPFLSFLPCLWPGWAGAGLSGWAGSWPRARRGDWVWLSRLGGAAPTPEGVTQSSLPGRSRRRWQLRVSNRK